MKILKVIFTAIDFDDKSLKLSPNEETPFPESLAESIGRSGILHPPILKETSPGSYIVASGRKRLKVAKEKLKLKGCNCQIISATTDPLKVWRIIIEEIQLGRPLTSIEKAEFFKKVSTILAPKDAANLFLPLMGLKPHAYLVKQFLVIADLEEPLKSAMQAGTIDQKAAKDLVPLSFRDRFALFDIMLNLQLSVANQKKLISVCKELERRKQKAILSILSDSAITEIINSEANTPQKAGNLMRYLAEQLSPQLSQAEKEFRAFSNNLNLPHNATLGHTPAFESDALTLQLNFKNRELLLKFLRDSQISP